MPVNIVKACGFGCKKFAYQNMSSLMVIDQIDPVTYELLHNNNKVRKQLVIWKRYRMRRNQER
jgi:hypothetical protein